MDLIPVIGFVRTWWKVALILVAAASLSFFLGRCEGQRIERNRAALERAEATIEGTTKADEGDEALRNAAGNRADALEGAIRNAVEQDPEGGNRAAGNVSGAVLDELRKRRR